MFIFGRLGGTFGRWLTIGLLLLVIWLLILDPQDRRPFMEEFAVRVVNSAESICRRVG